MLESLHKKLTPYQKGQLLYIHFMGDLKYRTDKKTYVNRKVWSRMIDTLTGENLITIDRAGVKLTKLGQEYVDRYHLDIPTLS